MLLRLRITTRAKKELKGLMNLVGITETGELIRRALRLYDYCVRERNAGAQILIRRPNEKEDLLLTDF